jgi:hypothetical protein
MMSIPSSYGINKMLVSKQERNTLQQKKNMDGFAEGEVFFSFHIFTSLGGANTRHPRPPAYCSSSSYTVHIVLLEIYLSIVATVETTGDLAVAVPPFASARMHTRVHTHSKRVVVASMNEPRVAADCPKTTAKVKVGQPRSGPQRHCWWVDIHKNATQLASGSRSSIRFSLQHD